MHAACASTCRCCKCSGSVHTACCARHSLLDGQGRTGCAENRLQVQPRRSWLLSARLRYETSPVSRRPWAQRPAQPHIPELLGSTANDTDANGDPVVIADAHTDQRPAAARPTTTWLSTRHTRCSHDGCCILTKDAAAAAEAAAATGRACSVCVCRSGSGLRGSAERAWTHNLPLGTFNSTAHCRDCACRPTGALRPVSCAAMLSANAGAHMHLCSASAGGSCLCSVPAPALLDVNAEPLELASRPVRQELQTRLLWPHSCPFHTCTTIHGSSRATWAPVALQCAVVGQPGLKQ
jgi:hypothetical protein